VVFTYPVAPPTVSIAAPANGASYAQGQAVSSRFSCDDHAGGSWLASCVDQSGRPSGSPLDTSKLGSHTFTVTATTRDGMTSTATVTYHVLPGGGGGGAGPGGTGGTGSGIFLGVQVHSQILTVLKNGTVKVKIQCPPSALGNCVGSVTLKWLGAITVSVKHKKRVLTIGRARFSIAAGHTGTVTIKLSKTALKLLARKRKLHVLGKVVAHDTRGVPKTSSATVALKAAPKRKR
jgi:hypothetical protein